MNYINLKAVAPAGRGSHTETRALAKISADVNVVNVAVFILLSVLESFIWEIGFAFLSGISWPGQLLKLQQIAVKTIDQFTRLLPHYVVST